VSKTPEELRKMAADLQRQADAAQAEGKDEWERLQRRAWMAADMAEERQRVLTGRRKGSQSDTLKRMLPAARVRISKGAARDKPPNQLQVVASFANHTLRSIAEALGCSNVFLTKAIRGDKAIRESWAKQIQEMTRSKEHPGGFAATKRNWPGGWAREPNE
jgi:hypothetical protein